MKSNNSKIFIIIF